MLEHKDIRTWPSLLKTVALGINSCYNRSTGYTPLELLFGTEFDTLKYEEIRGLESPKSYDSYLEELQYRLHFLRENAKENMEKAKTAAKTYKDKTINPLTLKEGDKVLIQNTKTILGKTDIPFLWHMCALPTVFICY